MQSNVMVGRELLEIGRLDMCPDRVWQQMVPVFIESPPEDNEIVFARKLGGIGDVIRIGVIAREYKRLYPDVNIVMAMPGCALGRVKGKGGVEVKDLFYGQDFFSKLITFEEGVKQYPKHKIVNFDNWMIVDFEAQLVFAKGNAPDRTEIMARMVNLDLPLSSLKPELVLGQSKLDFADKIIGDEKVVVLSLHSAGMHRSYPQMRCIRCGFERLGIRVVILDDFLLTKDFLEACALLRKSSLLITGDTTWVHVANAFDIPSIVIFSSSVPSTVIRTNKKAIPIHGGCTVDAFPCCLKPQCIDPKDWNSGEVSCFERINPEDVIEVALKVLKG